MATATTTRAIEKGASKARRASSRKNGKGSAEAAFQLVRASPDERESTLEPPDVARSAGLVYVSDERPGIRRRRAGRGFTYTSPDGDRIEDPETIARIRALAVPPAWTDVWICPSPRGHIQATGRDVRGRKQYRYHERWREVRDETKYGRLTIFGETLPRIRRTVDRHLSLRGLPRERVLATVVRLLDSTLIRVGNESYARENGSYGLTTFRDRHVDVDGSVLRFQFRGKGGKLHEVDLADRRLAAIVKRCQDIPGQELFQYLDEGGEPHPVESEDVNDYIREISDQDFTAKDFRTWGGTVHAAEALLEQGEFDGEAEGKSKVVRAIKEVAEDLRNTPAVCRKCYIHPTIVESYLDGTLLALWEQAERSVKRWVKGLRREEAVLLVLLRERMAS